MHLFTLLAAVAAFGLSNAAPTGQTCSYEMSGGAVAGQEKCQGTLASFKRNSPGAAALITTVQVNVKLLLCSGDACPLTNQHAESHRLRDKV